MDLVNFKWDQDADGIVTLTWDMPNRTLNVVSSEALTELTKAVEAIAADANVKGLVITSAKPGGFSAGADLDQLNSAAGSGGAAYQVNQMLKTVHQAFRRMETCGKPIAAAINGTALGGGYEITLACHYRVAAENPRAQIGLPESQVGLLPGFGGTQRLPRLIGAANALQLMTLGQRLDSQKALAQGLVHKVVPAEQLVQAAKDWIKSKPQPVQPWDKPDYRIPGGGPFSASGIQVFMVGNAMLRQKTYNNYPSQNYILSCVYEGLQVDFDTALKIEAAYFIKVLADPTARNMIRSLFVSMQDLGKGARRPKDVPPSEVKRLGVLGAGVMGAGIAYVSAVAGIDVILIDTTDERAAAGKKHASDLLDKAIKIGRSTPAKKEEALGRIYTTTDFTALKDVDLIIEAVFEDRKVKAEATKKADAVIGDNAIFGSNTSTLPITGLAEESSRPANFIGIHFFSPVERMMLVEIIRGKQTSDRAVAVALDYVRKIKKTPIVVNDARGFYTSRCFMRYVEEGLMMLSERIKPALIENAGRMAGMPMGPMEVLDSVGIDTSLKIARAYRIEAQKSDTPSAPERAMAWMVEEQKRPGVKANKGFYDYGEDGKKTRIWPELYAYGGNEWVAFDDPAKVRELEDRILTIQALEAARAFEEGVVVDPRDADVGAILGWGHAPYTGGPLSYIDTVGAAKFVERCERMAKAYGERFTPNALLRDMAAKGDTFYKRFAPQKAA